MVFIVEGEVHLLERLARRANILILSKTLNVAAEEAVNLCSFSFLLGVRRFFRGRLLAGGVFVRGVALVRWLFVQRGRRRFGMRSLLQR